MKITFKQMVFGGFAKREIMQTLEIGEKYYQILLDQLYEEKPNKYKPVDDSKEFDYKNETIKTREELSKLAERKAIMYAKRLAKSKKLDTNLVKRYRDAITNNLLTTVY